MFAYVEYLNKHIQLYIYRKEILSLQRTWVPHSLPWKRMCPPHLGHRIQGGATFASGVRGGGPNSDEGTDTLVLYVYYNPSTVFT